MEIDCNNKKVLKCLKSYLTANKYYDSAVDKSYDYFKQCIKILNDLKDNNIKITDNLVNIICYCLNPNHYHFILRQIINNGISNFMSKLNNSDIMSKIEREIITAVEKEIENENMSDAKRFADGKHQSDNAFR